MQSKIFYILLLLFVANCPIVFGQGEMSFKEESFDFGEITEGAIATHEFEFVNNGDEAIVINNVQASCGCTTPFWTKEPIPPRGKGLIKASYNSLGRQGSFSKTITVISNARKSSRILTIKGNVTARPVITPSARANFESLVWDLGTVKSGRKVEKSITVQNTGDEPLTVLSLESGCKCVTYKSLPTGLKPGESGDFEITYSPRQVGLFAEPITILTNDKNTPEVKLYLKAQVEEDKSAQSVVKESKASVPFN